MTFLRRLLLMDDHTCPWWFVHSFDNPLRRLVQNPRAILDGFVVEGHTVVDVGCGAGYFTLPLAEAVGPSGKVLALDLQSEMLDMVRRRALRRSLESAVECIQCEPQSLGLSETVDFVLAFWMVHEVQERGSFFQQIRSALRPSGQFLVVEPKVHVSPRLFEEISASAMDAGFQVKTGPRIWFSRSIVCSAPETGVSP
jgi:ubiquinone/menaquinone biosynthesis C-methylase UbiE